MEVPLGDRKALDSGLACQTAGGGAIERMESGG
jgi:hypothetical protein